MFNVHVYSGRQMAVLALCLILVSGCSLFSGGEEAPPEPLFKPGEYGYDALPGTEDLYNLRLSPNGTRIALIRRRTPGKPADPHDQLWIVNRDGSDPQIIAVNVGTVDWSPDGKKLAVGVWQGIYTYAYTIDLATGEATQWTGKPEQLLSGKTAGNPYWFQDGRRLLVSVWAKAYEQPFKRGIYIIDTSTGETTGPLVELMEAATPGNSDRYALGTKYMSDPDHPLDGNGVRYDFATGEWEWITHAGKDSVRLLSAPVPSPVSDLAVYSRVVENAWQLFLMNSDGTDVRQITSLGGDIPRWSYDGRLILFRRDVDKRFGAHYVPFVYDTATESEAALWPSLPDSVPVFPALSP